MKLSTLAMKLDSFQYCCFDIEGAVQFQTVVVLIDSLGNPVHMFIQLLTQFNLFSNAQTCFLEKEAQNINSL